MNRIGSLCEIITFNLLLFSFFKMIFPLYLILQFILFILIYSSLQIDVPESVTNRYCHSLSTFYISKHCIWIVVTGGLRDDDDDDDDDDRLVTDPYITMIVELGMIIIIIIYNIRYYIVTIVTII